MNTSMLYTPPAVRMRLWLAMALAAGAVLAAGMAPAALAGVQKSTGEPTALVKRTTERLFGELEKAGGTHNGDDPVAAARVETLVERIVSPRVDYVAVARKVLDEHWAGMSEAQRRRFTRQFHTMLVRTYATAVAGYTDAKIKYTGTRTAKDGRQTLVRTEVTDGGGKPVHVDYRLLREKGSWRLVDVVLDGASLLATYQRSFADRIDKRGVEGLIAEIQEKNRAPASAKG